MAVKFTDHIDALELTVRVRNCLAADSITTILQLVSRSKNQLRSITNLGKKSIAEIEQQLALHGLELSTVQMSLERRMNTRTRNMLEYLIGIVEKHDKQISELRGEPK